MDWPLRSVNLILSIPRTTLVEEFDFSFGLLVHPIIIPINNMIDIAQLFVILIIQFN